MGLSYLEAIEADVTAREALDELEDHGFDGYVDEATGNLMDEMSGEIVAMRDAATGTYAGEDVLNWLGY